MTRKLPCHIRADFHMGGFELNKVSKPALHGWMRVFCDEDPELFGGAESVHSGDGRRNWYEYVRRAMHASRTIESAPGGKGEPYFPQAG